MVRLGAIPRPDVPEYTTLMPHGVCHAPEDPYLGTKPADYDLTEVLLADPGLLEDHVWRLFTVPAAARMLHDHDRNAAEWVADNGRRWQTWTDALPDAQRVQRTLDDNARSQTRNC
jgi:hypothetical protein